MRQKQAGCCSGRAPTRFGNMTAQMRNFLDQTGKLWMEGALIGKAASVFTRRNQERIMNKQSMAVWLSRHPTEP